MIVYAENCVFKINISTYRYIFTVLYIYIYMHIDEQTGKTMHVNYIITQSSFSVLNFITRMQAKSFRSFLHYKKIERAHNMEGTCEYIE